MINYYELKYLVTETFYENILEEKYTIGQSAGRCLVEFYSELRSNDIESLIVYSTVLARVAKHEKSILTSLEKEIQQMSNLYSKKELLNNISEEEVEALKDDVDFVYSKLKNE